MKTPDEIKKGLSVCSNAEAVAEQEECEGCPYYVEGQIMCGINAMLKDSLDYIEKMEERVSLMLIQMHGDCGCCKHRDERGAICADCLQDSRRPKWEYEGLPEVKG